MVRLNTSMARAPRQVRTLVQMVAKAAGMDPQGRLSRAASALLWHVLRLRARSTAAAAI